jgi:methionyl-tRNA synthetase
VDKEKVDAMIEESKDTGENKPATPEPTPAITAEPIKPECTIEDFAKIDLRIAKVVKAERVEGADKLLRLQLDIGGIQKNVLAGIAQAYQPETLVGKIVILFANLKPRQMRFGLSEGMILASGAGGKEIFMLTADTGAKPGAKVS